MKIIDRISSIAIHLLAFVSTFIDGTGVSNWRNNEVMDTTFLKYKEPPVTLYFMEHYMEQVCKI